MNYSIVTTVSVPAPAFSPAPETVSEINKPRFVFWSALSRPQKLAIISLLLLVLVLPVVAYSTLRETRSSSRAAIPLTPITPPEPTPTPTPTPILRNGSFEIDANNDNRPDQWGTRNLDINDILDTTIFYDGAKSFRFSPAAADKEQLLQNLNYSGVSDEEIRLEVYHQSDGQVTLGKAGVILTITYADGRKETSSGVFPYAMHGWKKKTLVIITDEPYSRIKVNFFNTNQDTNVRIDKSSLSVIPGAAARGVKQTDNELSQKELDRLQ